MRTGDIIHGFKVTKESVAADIGATLFELTHIKTGAPLFFIDRDDENMTLEIGFSTHPEDSSGVFHIIEHTVLCGSRKYPLKETYTALAKGSLKTLLNAYTYADKTVYPISTRNKRDLLNLADAYLDSLFHPLAMQNEAIFLGEGYRLEPTEDGKGALHGGVVYNEMTGAYSSPSELAARHLGMLLFPGSVYAEDSGGDPAVIPTLTYEKFKDEYHSHYHPKNSCTVIDGRVPLDELLPLIDSYFSEFDSNFEPPKRRFTGGDIITERRRVPFSTSDESEKARFYLLWRAARADEMRDSFALSVICDAIAGSSDSPLKRKILDTGLCSSFFFSFVGGSYIGSLSASFEGMCEENADELALALDEALCEILERGIDPELLRAALNNYEFYMRESDFGSYPRGAVYASAVMESFFFGTEPVEALSYGEIFSSLRELISTDYYTELLGKAVGGKHAELLLCPVPSADPLPLTDKESVARAERDEAIHSAWQSAPDTEEALSSIPHLSLSDIGEPPRALPTRTDSYNGSEIIYHDADSSGIVYLNLYFDLSDTAEDRLYELCLMRRLFGEVSTASGAPIVIHSEIKKHLGLVSLSLLPVKRPEGVKLYLHASVSALESSKDKIPALLEEYLLTARLDEREPILRKLAEVNDTMSEHLCATGHSIAVSHLGAAASTLGALRDKISGLSMLLGLKSDANPSEERIAELGSFFLRTRERALTRSRLTLSQTGTADESLARKIIDLFPLGTGAPCVDIKPKAAESFGIVCPAATAYAAFAATLPEEPSEEIFGKMLVAEKILSYDILWERVRQRGGAYGAGFSVRGASRLVCAHSYRDPSPARSIEAFSSIPALIREFAEGVGSLDDYIIGTVGELEGLSTVRRDAHLYDIYHFTDRTPESTERIRRAVLSFDKSALLECADLIESLGESFRFAAVASEDTLSKIPSLDKIYRL